MRTVITLSLLFLISCQPKTKSSTPEISVGDTLISSVPKISNDTNELRSSIWEISNGENHLYIGGTIHVLRPSDFPLPEVFEQVYKESDELVFETDMAVINSPAFAQKLMRVMSYSDGRTLRSELSPEVYAKVTERLRSKGIPPHSFDQLKPSMVSILLTQYEMQEYDMAAEGVDIFFSKSAKRDNKKMHGLESAEEQLAFLSGLGEDDPDALILNTLEEMHEMKNLINSMISSWRKGDEKQLEEFIIREMEEKYPSIYQEILVDRNNNWFPAILGFIKSEPVEMILVGAAHLVGDEGLLNMLRAKGYSVTQVTISETEK